MSKASATDVRTSLPQATIGETLAVIAEVLLPNIAKGVIIRRPKVVALAERLNLDKRAVRRVQQLRNRYGSGPLLLRIPVRSQAILLDPEHVHRVLNESPEPFATASSEKRAALSHFQPEGVLISHGPARAERRRFNEAVLDTSHPMHRLAERFVAVVAEEAELLRSVTRHRGELSWDDFAISWFRVVRRVVFGDGARDDHELTELLKKLRAAANWAFLHPKRRAVRQAFYTRLHAHLARAEAGSLAAIMAGTPSTKLTAPDQQVPQWLFAFDPAGMATFRTLALLAAHPEHQQRARDEIRRTAGQPDRPFLRACILDALRLWPTTPMILRQTTQETTWNTGVMPAQTGVLIFAVFLHRDDERLPYADSFAPDLWLRQRSDADWPLVPFSGGPAMCPGRNLVLLVGSAMLAELIGDHHVALKPPTRLDAQRPMPGTLNNYDLRFTFSDMPSTLLHSP
jgi:cytochrome P450